MKRLNPPVYFLIALILSIVLHFTVENHGIRMGLWCWAGVLLALAGGWITVWADAIFKRVNTTVKPDQTPSVLVTSGPFGISRHPMYLGMLSLSLGIACVLGSLLSLIGPLFLWAVLQFVFIPHEESVMHSVFGDDYFSYCRQVRMWI